MCENKSRSTSAQNKDYGEAILYTSGQPVTVSKLDHDGINKAERRLGTLK